MQCCGPECVRVQISLSLLFLTTLLPAPHRLSRIDLTKVLPVATADAHVSSPVPPDTSVRLQVCACVCVRTRLCVRVICPGRT